MTQAVTKIMAATVRASARGLDIVNQARCKKGWTKTDKVWAELACTSSATLRRFWAGLAIQTPAFRAICETVGIENWETIANFDNEPISDSQISSKRLCFAIAGSIEEIDKHKLDAMVALLRKIGGDASIEILDIDEGSIKLILGGSPEGLERIKNLFESGQIEEIVETAVQDVHFLSKGELVQLIGKNGGSGVNLNGADLSGSYLSGTYLSRADLREANLSGSYLSGSYLSGANLSRTNLREANLSRTNLLRADLSGVDLSGANVTQARFVMTEGLSEQSQQDLIQRGAIFVDTPGEEAFTRSPVPSGRR